MRAQWVVGLIAVAIGLGVLWSAPVAVVTLEGSPEGVSCRYRSRVLCLLTTRTAEVHGVTRADVEVTPHGSPETTRWDGYQLVLTTTGGEQRPPWLRWRKTARKKGSIIVDTGALPGLEDRINRLAGAAEGSDRQRSWSPGLLALGGGAVLFGILALWPLVGFRRRRTGPEVVSSAGVSP